MDKHVPKRKRGNQPDLLKKFEEKYPRICSECDVGHNKKTLSNGKKIPVQLHHKDGNHHNNDFKNLIWLCEVHHMAAEKKQHWENIRDTLKRNNSSFNFDLFKERNVSSEDKEQFFSETQKYCPLAKEIIENVEDNASSFWLKAKRHFGYNRSKNKRKVIIQKPKNLIKKHEVHIGLDELRYLNDNPEERFENVCFIFDAPLKEKEQ